VQTCTLHAIPPQWTQIDPPKALEPTPPHPLKQPPPQVITAVGAIEFSTRYSKECCTLIADSGGTPALLAFMRSCNRSKPHAEMLRLALAALHNVARWRDLVGLIVGAPECVAVLSERLQMFRDMEVRVVCVRACVCVCVEGGGAGLGLRVVCLSGEWLVERFGSHSLLTSD